MPTADIRAQFFAILAKMLNVPQAQLTAQSSRDNVTAWDSLKHLHLMLALEEEFGIEFSDQELSELKHAERLLEAVAAKIAA